MNNNVDYKRIRNLSDLRAERNRIYSGLAESEMRLEEDWDDFSEIFTLGYWVDNIGAKLSNVSSSMGIFYSGYRFISSFFKDRQVRKTKKKVRRARRSCSGAAR